MTESIKKPLPIGISDFKKVREDNYLFVDKSLLIKELIDAKIGVTLFPRPRRFGKTLNLSMLRYFFEKMNVTNRHLFDRLAVANHPEIMAHQGRYPVIFLTFKDVKELTWEHCYEKMRALLAKEFERHKYLEQSDMLDDIERKWFKKMRTATASEIDYHNSLKNLTQYLHAHHGVRPIILIDEYDTPINAGYVYGYYELIISFLRGLLCAALKDNSHLEQGVITGIMRVAKESIFSGLNNLAVYSLLSERYDTYFGLSQTEVDQVLAQYNLSSQATNVKQWYNGYTMGNQHDIYNPWSILHFIDHQKFEPYWVNTSDNQLVRDLLLRGQDELKSDFELLLQGQVVKRAINENIIFPELFSSIQCIWSLLLFSGYLRCNEVVYDEIQNAWIASLAIPNKEVMSLFKTLIDQIAQEPLGMHQYKQMLHALVTGDIKTFQRAFRDFVLKSFSIYDVCYDEPERVYHAFALGILVSLGSTHEVKSNRESGYGRYDISVIPHDHHQLGIIIEFKKADINGGESLKEAADDALAQIEARKYETELHARGIKEVLKLGIAFKGKEVMIIGVS